MWQLENKTPFACDRGFVRDIEGREIWVVAVKATFCVLPGKPVSLHATQDRVVGEPVYWGEPNTSTLRYPSELEALAPRCDVLVHAHAYNPALLPWVDASVQVAQMHKRVRVFGARYWQPSLRGVRASECVPRERTPVRWEQAFGGAQSIDNPIGCGQYASQDTAAGRPLPCIESPSQLVGSWQDRLAPVGFAPVAPAWGQRARFAGTWDETWRRTRRPLAPRDFDPQYFQSAPVDQQFNRIRGGELVSLENLSPRSERFSFELPRVALRFTTILGKSSVEHGARLRTVMFEPDEDKLTMLWIAALNCDKREHELARTRILEKSVLSSRGSFLRSSV